jgi:catechol 2,3-dioxygenase-like lactoylglutathione lyase family enzyme
VSKEPIMTGQTDTIATKTIIAVALPQLFVADIRAACAFFERKLGFSTVFTYGEPPYYAEVRRDAARLNLRCMEKAVIDPDVRDRHELLSATLLVATRPEIEQLAHDFEEAGVTFVQTPANKPWGARDFIIKDIDGNLLLFSGPAD